MSTQLTQRDPWRWPVFFLWSVFFLLGFWPELTFGVLRTAGYVFTQNAIINSYNVITWALTGFVIHFVYHRCVDAKMPPIDALWKSMQLGVVAFVAFVDMPLIEFYNNWNAIGLMPVLSMVLTKALSWLYLYALVLRYYWHQRPEIISHSLTGLLSVSGARVRGGVSETSGNNDRVIAQPAPRPPMEESTD